MYDPKCVRTTLRSSGYPLLVSQLYMLLVSQLYMLLACTDIDNPMRETEKRKFHSDVRQRWLPQRRKLKTTCRCALRRRRRRRSLIAGSEKFLDKKQMSELFSRALQSIANPISELQQAHTKRERL